MRSKILISTIFTLASHCLASIGINTSTLPNGILKDAYLADVRVSGGCAPYAWQVTSGALPAGITMKKSSNTSSVTLAGTPSKAATYSFTISARACNGHTARASYKVVIQAAADHVVDLRWKPSSSADVVGYNIYRGPDGKSWRKINPSLAASTMYSDSTVADKSTLLLRGDRGGCEGQRKPKVEYSEVLYSVSGARSQNETPQLSPGRFVAELQQVRTNSTRTGCRPRDGIALPVPSRKSLKHAGNGRRMLASGRRIGLSRPPRA